MKKLLPLVAWSCLAWSHISAAQTPTDKLDLRLHWEAGKSYTLHSLLDQQITQTVQEQKVNVVQAIGFDYVFAVQDVDATGTATVKLTYKAVHFRNQTPNGVIDYDSTDPPKEVPLEAKGFAALVGESLILKLNSVGQVLELQGAEPMLARALTRLGLPPGPLRAEAEDNLRKQFNEQAIRASLENMLAFYPGKPVGIGDSWAKKVTISKGFPMILENTWTLKARRLGMAVIEAHSTIEPNPTGDPLQLGAMKLNYSVSGQQQGTLEVAESSGWISYAQLNQKAAGQIQVKSSPLTPQGKSWPITIKSSIRLDSDTAGDNGALSAPNAHQ